jgi:peptidoglycan/xylan/chitin deacetylase (PgdA/CDA1 family)
MENAPADEPAPRPAATRRRGVPRTVRRVTGLLVAVLLLLAVTGPVRADRAPGPNRSLGRPIAGPQPDPAAPVIRPEPEDEVPPGLTREIMARVPTFDQRSPAVPVPLAGGPKATWLDRIPTDEPVAFITIDDGWTKLPEAVALVRAARVPVTLFLTTQAINDNPAYFNAFRDMGVAIEAHTISHPHLRGRSYSAQQHEICGSADRLAAIYGKRPTLFRAPFGEHDATTLTVMRDCSLHAALFWKETVNAGVVRYQQGNVVQRGDIILMHFRPRFIDDFIAALNAIKAAGLTPALLEDYLPSPG